MLKKELSIFSFEDLLNFFPFRHLDKTAVTPIAAIDYNADYVQIAATLVYVEVAGEKYTKRLVANFKDSSGFIEVVWFKGVQFVQKNLQVGSTYLLFGKTSFFNGKLQMAHPEMEAYVPQQANASKHLAPVYSSTEKLKTRGLSGRQIALLTFQLLSQLQPNDIAEILPQPLIEAHQLMPRHTAYRAVHFPVSAAEYNEALKRLKFEELFIAQLKMQRVKLKRHNTLRGVLFNKIGDLFNNFYNHYLPFSLTNAQKKALKEIRQDTARGAQMNRLLQGDVGSGKTIVALLSMLMAADNGYQSCLMAPTEILAQQHFEGISSLLQPTGLTIKLLTGNTKAKERRSILESLLSGELMFLVGTHALIEEVVQFKNLGLAVVDEQHRFGVAQRAALWKKAAIPPHILVMTATPIPRTLAMTAYGDLDCSVMDELPPGRHPITTVHRVESKRYQVMEFLKQEIALGRQAYIVYPLIEESAALNYEDLMQGYEQVKSYFPEPKYYISMVHGKMKPDLKETNMQRFATNDTQILVATTVIEVGVNVPNASVMVIESAEKFGLSQLHQLRGRVGRGAHKSYCVLLTAEKISHDAKERLNIMCATNDGFKISEKDLELRGPGDIEGTRQSGALNFKLASIVNDKPLLEIASVEAAKILTEDLDLTMQKHVSLNKFLQQKKGSTAWSKIS